MKLSTSGLNKLTDKGGEISRYFTFLPVFYKIIANSITYHYKIAAEEKFFVHQNSQKSNICYYIYR